MYKLQHRLTWFTDTFRSYLTETVIFFTTKDMEKAMEKAEDIDDISRIHINYTTKLQERALLTRDLKPIHKAVIEVLDLGALFTRTIASAQKDGASRTKRRRKLPSMKSSVLHVNEELSDSDVEEESEGVDAPTTTKETSQQSLREVLQTIDVEFSRLLPFIAAGLRSVGRVGAEPMWEQLAERLEWEGKNGRPS